MTRFLNHGAQIVKQQITRKLTDMEAIEMQRKKNDLASYRQRKGMMLNLENHAYTQDSKPMGLAGMFDMEVGVLVRM